VVPAQPDGVRPRDWQLGLVMLTAQAWSQAQRDCFKTCNIPRSSQVPQPLGKEKAGKKCKQGLNSTNETVKILVSHRFF